MGWLRTVEDSVGVFGIRVGVVILGDLFQELNGHNVFGKFLGDHQWPGQAIAWS